MFEHGEIDAVILRKRAYNLRWATVPEGVIPLTAADPDFRSAPQIAEAISRFVKDRYLCYGPPEGLPEFREAMAAHYLSQRHVPVQPGHLFPVDSAAFGIYIICKAFLGKDDEAIIFDPVDFLFRYSIESIGAKAVPMPIGPGEPARFERIEKLITKRTKLICLCNPLNPTGKVFTAQELRHLAEIALRHNLVIMSDEIWSDIVFPPHTYTSIASLGESVRKNTVTVTGFSKSYGLAGLRIGAVMTHTEAHYKKLMDASMHHSTIHGANIVSQVAAVAAMRECADWLLGFVGHLHRMRDLTVDALNMMKDVQCLAPEGCYVAFADIRGTGKSSQEIRDLLMEKAKVAVVPGLAQWFGGGAEGYIRLSFATSHEILTEALERIAKTINAI
jgi:aminotransferase